MVLTNVQNGNFFSAAKRTRTCIIKPVAIQMETCMKMWLIFTVLINIAVLCVSLEEFVVRGPNELHNVAVDTYIEERRKNPEIKDFGDDSPLMKRARDHAVKRLASQREEDLSLMAPSDSGDAILALPAPDEQQSFLTAAVTTRGASYEVMAPAELNSLQIGIREDIGMGAISKAGALPLGEGMEWVKFVEDKLKRDNKMDHQSLLWELGSEVVEKQQEASGGMNITLEEELMANLTIWFENGGGKLKYVEPTISKESGIKLTATEDIIVGESIVSVPIKLTMCRISARNVLIKNRGKYLGEELKKTFEKNEVWALSIFLLHEWFKEFAGAGSKWGPYLRTLRMRALPTPTVQALQSTRAIELSKNWLKSSNELRFWSGGSDGPCSPTTYICNTKPNDKFGGNRFEAHHLRWAYWVVKQNAVRVHHTSTGQSFLALVPFFNMVDKRVDSGGGVTFDLDGGISIRVGAGHEEGEAVGTHPGNFTDSEFFMRYLQVPNGFNPYNSLSLSLPGALPEGSDYHLCLKKSGEDTKRKCRDKGQDLMWKMKTLSEWRKAMNLPPRLGDLRLWATRLHLYGDDEEEQKKLSAANQLLAGLPVSTDDIPAEDQLMLLGIAQNNDEAMAMVAGSNRPPPQLYSAPDPEEDPEAQRAMENLATLAAQVHQSISFGNIVGNATKKVLNQTREFFQHGVMPKAGLDELDEFILKKMGMLAHCGVDKDMKITHGNITKELMCAMRVHLMNETEMNVFCPAEAKVFHENCQNVEFMNYTAISLTNEINVIEAFRSTLHGLLASYPNSVDDDRDVLAEMEGCGENCAHGPVHASAIRLRMREKELLMATLKYLDDHENRTVHNEIPFQLDMKRIEREVADLRLKEHEDYIAEIKRLAAEKNPLAIVPVDIGGGKPKLNLTLVEGADVKDTVTRFCQQNNIPLSNSGTLEDALRKQVRSPQPLFLLMGVVTPTGYRHVLGIPEGANATIETGVFCAKYGIKDEDECDKLQKRVTRRLTGNNNTYPRNILGTLNVDAPDGRKLMLVIRESEQHDLLQFTSDFLEYYKMHSQNSVNIVANEIHKRLPEVVLQIPVALNAQRGVQIRFARNDNITAVVEGFVDFYELSEDVKTQIYRLARRGMAPGSYMV